MKTPRELLLKRHQAAEPKLDAITRRVIAEPAPPVTDIGESSLTDRLRDWFTMPRFGWSALAAAWVVIIGLNMATRESSPSLPTHSVARAQQLQSAEALREQRRLYAELIGNATADAQSSQSVPRPHSARRPETAFA